MHVHDLWFATAAAATAHGPQFNSGETKANVAAAASRRAVFMRGVRMFQKDLGFTGCVHGLLPTPTARSPQQGPSLDWRSAAASPINSRAELEGVRKAAICL